MDHVIGDWLVTPLVFIINPTPTVFMRISIVSWSTRRVFFRDCGFIITSFKSQLKKPFDLFYSLLYSMTTDHVSSFSNPPSANQSTIKSTTIFDSTTILHIPSRSYSEIAADSSPICSNLHPCSPPPKPISNICKQ